MKDGQVFGRRPREAYLCEIQENMMAYETALNTIESLINARRLKDYDAAWACYEPSASVVLQPGHIESGESAIKAFIRGRATLPCASRDIRLLSPVTVRCICPNTQSIRVPTG